MRRWAPLILILSGAVSAHAGVVEFTDKAEWIDAVGPFTTIDFTGFPHNTFITDQYADLGVTFTDGNDHVFLSENLFPNDGAGLSGSVYSNIDLAFDTPQLWIAVHFPGDVRFELFSRGELLSVTTFIAGGAGNFGGLISPDPFDAVIISDPFLDVYIDDLHFGVPAPPALAVMALAFLFAARRSRMT